MQLSLFADYIENFTVSSKHLIKNIARLYTPIVWNNSANNLLDMSIASLSKAQEVSLDD